mmetsp:Transcript_35053/g.68223  ORF Transcript_35053/g.68223 Transcript_35053/m.68223 type:complete len:224 (+) Transcript_35053:302-973(+)
MGVVAVRGDMPPAVRSRGYGRGCGRLRVDLGPLRALARHGLRHRHHGHLRPPLLLCPRPLHDARRALPRRRRRRLGAHRPRSVRRVPPGRRALEPAGHLLLVLLGWRSDRGSGGLGLAGRRGGGGVEGASAGVEHAVAAAAVPAAVCPREPPVAAGGGAGRGGEAGHAADREGQRQGERGSLGLGGGDVHAGSQGEGRRRRRRRGQGRRRRRRRQRRRRQQRS